MGNPQVVYPTMQTCQGHRHDMYRRQDEQKCTVQLAVFVLSPYLHLSPEIRLFKGQVLRSVCVKAAY
jgi:hypothetical protein